MWKEKVEKAILRQILGTTGSMVGWVNVRLIFMDESGYVPNWEKDMGEQPFYVLSAVIVPLENYKSGSYTLRAGMKELNIPGVDNLGQGFEIKASSVFRGEGWWNNHNNERDIVRQLILSFPKENGGNVIVVVIDKKAHYDKYEIPENPYSLALKFVLERIQHYLNEVDDYGIVIYDLNHKLINLLSKEATDLIRDGSAISKWTIWGLFEFTLGIDRILEFTFGVSRDSLGLIVADFFATTVYQYHKNRHSPHYERWWDLLTESLYRDEDGEILGYGYKLFP